MKKFFRYILAGILSFTYLITVTIPAFAVAYESHESGEGWSANVIYGERLYGETFTASSTHYINGIWLHAGGQGTTPDATIHLKATSGGVPYGGDLASGTFDTSDCTYIDDLWQHAWEYFELDSPYLVTSGTKYFIGVSCPAGDASNNIYIMSDSNVSDEFADGTNYRSTNNGASYPTSYANDDWVFINDDEAPALVPTVMLYNESFIQDGVYLSAHGTLDGGVITDAYFEYGTVSETYTDNISFDVLYTNGDFISYLTGLTIGETYYYRAKALNAQGWGYSEEGTFDYNPVNLVVNIDAAYIGWNVGGNWTASWIVSLNQQVTSNVSARFSEYVDFSVPIDVYLWSSAGGKYNFSTQNPTAGNYGVLKPSTTYYCQGLATYNGTVYYSQIRVLETENVTPADRPTVEFLEIEDVSSSYSEADYAFKMKGKVNTTNTTDNVLNQGFAFSLSTSSDGFLLPIVYHYPSYKLNPDNTFELVITITDSNWYTGQKLYFKAYVTTPYHGKVYSPTVYIEPFDEANTGGAEPPSEVSIEEVVDNARNSLGMNGIFGTWAFMGLIELILAMLFGGVCFAVNGAARVAVGVAWLLCSVAVVGAFMFTGQLGIWPIIILIGGVVSLIVIIVGNKLSGGGVDG